MYRYDASYAVEVQKAYPDRFALVKPVDPQDPAVGDVIEAVGATVSAVTTRLFWTLTPTFEEVPTLPAAS